VYGCPRLYGGHVSGVKAESVGPPTPRLDVLASEGLRLPDFNVEPG
jgi:arylsulfatase A-like enzyme